MGLFSRLKTENTLNYYKRILCVALFFVGFSAFANPTADFTLSVKQGCVPLNISFTDRSSGGVTSYLWDFGNGNQSTLKNPSAIYYRSGNFRVTLTVTDANGLTSTKVFSPVRVFSNPVADFKADTVACIGEKLNFTDLSVKADTIINKWTWDYGDGNLSSSQNSSHAYSYSTYFSVGLTVTDAFGCKSLVNKARYIRVKPSPKAEFDLDNDFACKLPGEFKAKNKSTGGGTYKWFCTDGSSGSGNEFKTNIGSFGQYTIKLVAIGNNSCTDTIEKPVLVERLVPKFKPNTGTICIGGKVKFVNESTPNLNQIKYEWDFGDGNSSTDRDPTHTYSTTGKFTVKLTMEFGPCIEVTTREINVNPSPDVTIRIEDSVGCEAPFKAKFTIIGDDYSGAVFDFGDETSPSYYAKGLPIQHTYTEAGFFSVKVKVTNSFGCTQEIDVDERIQINTQSIEIDPQELKGCLPKTQKYTAIENLVEEVRSYQWVFTDSAATYSTKTVDKTFRKPGNFNVILVVTTVDGCIVKDSAKISVGNKYLPTFKILKYHICNKDTIHFINTSPDSVKSRVKFNLKVSTDELKGEEGSDTSQIKKDSLLFTGHGGKHFIKINATHFGCENESEFSDSVYVHGPFVGVVIKAFNCKRDMVRLKPTFSWANRARLEKNDSVILDFNQLTELQKKNGDIITSNKPSKFVLFGYNDTFGCKDSIEPEPIPREGPEIKHNLSQKCTPSKAKISHNGTIQNFKWVFPNGDTSILESVSYTFYEAGNHKVKLIGQYPGRDCIDTTYYTINVEGVKLRGNVIQKGKCLPLEIELYDSSAGQDQDFHTWKINGETIEAKELKNNFTVSSIPIGKDYVEVVHKVQTGQGCISERVYKLQVNGPVATYTMQRFSICDTPMFYFKTFPDSSKSKFPLTYKWELDNGFSSNNQNFNSKFSTIGMNFYTLTVTDRTGCKTVFKDSFEVSPNMLQPLFKADPTGRFCPPLECKFGDMSKTFNSDIVKWEWDFGDGSTSQLKDPKKLYLLPGNYDVTLKITSRNGCTAILKKPAYVIVNGPRGSYDFDRGDACLPHQVQFRGITLDSAAMEWDLGDGVVRQGNYFTHTYTRRGRYIPAMILSDTLGCKYTLPPIDTIEVFDYPDAKIIADGLCLKQPIRVGQKSISNHESAVMKYQWYFNGYSANPGADSVFMPEGRGDQSIRLIVENEGKCRDTAEHVLRIYAPNSDFETGSSHVCLGQQMPFKNKSNSEIEIIKFEWDFGDGNQSIVKEPSHQYVNSGAYSIQLIATDAMNCKDTSYKPAYALIGDTIAPPQVPIRRASVIDNRTIELVFSKYPDFDFNSYTIYRESEGTYFQMKVIKDRNDTFYVDPLCNTLKRSYCYKIRTQNLCLLNSDLVLSKPHCTIETKADGLEEANFVKWSPYIGFDSIAQYQIWRQDYYNPTAYKLIDSVSSTQLNYTDSLIQCNTRQNYRITAIEFKGFNEYSNSDTASAKPYYFNKTKPNYAWRTTVEENEFTRIEWLNNAQSKWGIKGYLLNKTIAEGPSMFKNKYFDALDTIFTDDFVKVDKHSYIYTVRGVDNCNDTTPYSNVAQSILLKGYFDEQTLKPAITWNLYQLWDQGVDFYEIEKKFPDGSFKVIAKVAADVSVFIDMEAESNCQPDYTYRVRAISKTHTGFNESTWSLSNEVQVYPHSTLFVPTAFSPDNNGINEYFNPKGSYIKNYHISIYNRWGEKIFDSYECLAPWDGRFKNEVCMEGVYLYTIEAMGADNKTYILKGTFTLLR